MVSQRQYGGIRRAAEVGRIIRDSYAEVEDMFREGMSIREIAEQLDVQEKYGVSQSTANNSIRNALRGHDGRLVKAYVGLIDDLDEYRQISDEHRKSFGERNFSEGLGIHALSHDAKVANGKRGGTVSLERKVGVHAMSPEEVVLNVRQNQLARGNTLWNDDERSRAYELSLQEAYLYGVGSRHAGKPMLSVIAEVLNHEFHKGRPIRKKSTVNQILVKERKNRDNSN